jgi:hypothetical protein
MSLPLNIPFPHFYGFTVYHSLAFLKDCLQADIMQFPLTNGNMQWRKART